MTVFFSIDNRFIIPFRVAIHSLSRCNSQLISKVVLVHDFSSQKLVTKLVREIESYFPAVTISLFDGKLLDKSRFREVGIGFMTYMLLYVERLLPEEDRVLCIDADMIFQASLQAISELDFDDKLVAGVEDPWAKGRCELRRNDIKNCSEAKNWPYLNGGFLLLNLKGMRKADFSSKCLDTARSRGELCTYAEQSCINHVAQGRVICLSNVYNKMIGLATTNQNFEEENIHYAGRKKPWNRYSNRKSFRYWDSYYKKYISWWQPYKFSPMFWLRSDSSRSIIYAIKNIAEKTLLRR